MLSATHFDELRGARAREIRPRSDRRHPLSLGDLSSVSFGSHHKIFHNPRLFSIMVPLTVMRSKAPNGVMGKQGSKSGRTTYSLVTSGIALFFLVQTLAFVFSPNGRIAFSNGGAGASSIAMAGEVCLANADDGGKAPKLESRRHSSALRRVRRQQSRFSASRFGPDRGGCRFHSSAARWSAAAVRPATSWRRPRSAGAVRGPRAHRLSSPDPTERGPNIGRISSTPVQTARSGVPRIRGLSCSVPSSPRGVSAGALSLVFFYCWGAGAQEALPTIDVGALWRVRAGIRR